MHCHSVLQIAHWQLQCKHNCTSGDGISTLADEDFNFSLSEMMREFTAMFCSLGDKKDKSNQSNSSTPTRYSQSSAHRTCDLSNDLGKDRVTNEAVNTWRIAIRA